METRRDARINQLIQALKRSDKLHLKEAATLLGVSEMTIRRDLNSHSGPVVLLGGYIVLEPRAASHYLLSDQQTRLVDEKRLAARHAASLLEAHQMAFFDCGTTTPWIIDAIDNELPFTGVCYSLNTFLALQEKPLCRVILCGGEFYASNGIFKPIDGYDTLNHLCPDIAFYSAAGVHPQQGATCFNLEELPVKHWAMRQARYHVLVVDHSKFGKIRPAKMGELSAFDAMACDRRPDDEMLTLAKAQKMTLLY
ncbi:MAG: DNA-binding transcriptional repressor DeoR [Yokenella regensburgei]|jgi:DeoR family deoxyribose operon repressor|uniref:DeoR family transcriptional regulator n=1 Tax=Yokenella regensburgei TaxID=158877 RepID=A0ABX9S4Q4_9ENTR|nr:DNA-binding transcriptional repressor DeoR [Yokenella regensburgei]EHM46996.1 deoxyribose operon repressor [Yokenella regensburgei ATCC 43003]MDQ4431514.1 DNA-binding transcriptional repressor DeoR [Yokenella regensburgei]MDR3104580.1 DNA-binding transcriptional repressor DeoR [Yokenella regensburgei]QIU88100.1 DNA-binding transcriptional repressor DeoR [Yokenella regensburgei]RKR65271.1 DeoR family transcriptional regulator [Yokenella regensburgei]